MDRPSDGDVRPPCATGSYGTHSMTDVPGALEDTNFESSTSSSSLCLYILSTMFDYWHHHVSIKTSCLSQDISPVECFDPQLAVDDTFTRIPVTKGNLVQRRMTTTLQVGVASLPQATDLAPSGHCPRSLPLAHHVSGQRVFGVSKGCA